MPNHDDPVTSRRSACSTEVPARIYAHLFANVLDRVAKSVTPYTGTRESGFNRGFPPKS